MKARWHPGLSTGEAMQIEHRLFEEAVRLWSEKRTPDLLKEVHEQWIAWKISEAEDRSGRRVTLQQARTAASRREP